MVSALLRALAAISLMLMPVGASQAAAAGAPAHEEVAVGHCDDEGEAGKAFGAADKHCASCAAVPAIGAPILGDVPRPRVPVAVSVANFLLGLELEIATPPPRQA